MTASPAQSGRGGARLVFVAVILVVVAASGASYLLLSTPTPSAATTEGTTTLANGTVVYSYPTADLSASITIQVGQTFAVRLSSNAGSTGYDWNVSSSGGVEFLNYTVVSPSTLAGGPQLRDYYFRASQPGSQSVTLKDQRQFSPYEAAATISIGVTVVGAGPLLLTYNFQVNGTGGSLFLVLKNYGTEELRVASVSFDQAPVTPPALALDLGCTNFVMGAECGITLAFGPSDVPANGTAHTLVVSMVSGVQLTYSVTAGWLYHAACTYTSSC